MRLSQFLQYDTIVVQCHDNPDADAISSGFGVYTYLKQNGKNVRFIYGGRYRIQKSNLILMVEELQIPIEYVEELDAPDLLITVDCQYGQGNVTRFEAKEVAVIDHHQVSGELPELSEVRSNLGSCATVVKDLLLKENMDVNQNENLATALYYGLMTDTNGFTEICHPLDKDLRDDTIFRRTAITKFRNANLSFNEMQIAGKALLGYEYDDKDRFAVVETEPCDPNILGMISDLMLEVDEVDSCLVYSIMPYGVKISVRSCIKEVKASELAAFITQGIGNGGGHLEKAGGFIQMELLAKELGSEALQQADIKGFLKARMQSYFSDTEIIYFDSYEAKLEDLSMYKKKKAIVGYVDPEDFFALETKMLIRTIKGDVELEVEPDTVIMIGTNGEVYPSDETRFAQRYRLLDEPFVYSGEYEPIVKEVLEGKNIKLIPYAKACVSTGEVVLYAKKLDHRVKVFSRWDPEQYYLGKPGDYLAIHSDDLSDISVIAGNIFENTYDLV